MEIAAGVSIAQNLIFGYLLSRNNGQQLPDVEDKRIVNIFEMMKVRMGLEDRNISLKAYDVGHAYATGSLLRNNSSVLANVDKCSEDTDQELIVLFAHELAHLKNHDSLILPAFIAALQTTMVLGLTILCGLSPLAAFAISFGVTVILVKFVVRKYFEHQADVTASKVLTDNELIGWIRNEKERLEICKEFHNDPERDFFDHLVYTSSGNQLTDFAHPPTTFTVRMLEKELTSREQKQEEGQLKQRLQTV